MDTSISKITWTLALLCVLAGGAWARCCFPSQYTANQGIFRSTVRGGNLSIKLAMNVYYYDAINQMEAVLENIIEDGQTTTMKVIKDYNVTKTKYVISEDGNCSRTLLDAFKAACIPDWAYKVVSSKVGNSTSGMPIELFNSSAGNTTSYLITAPDGCYPVLDVSAVPSGPSPYMQVVQFHNITLGIQDPSVFNVPPSCN
ncbi:uncharacterized protein LOC127879299 [Dreissena polymorpha]|uniref:Uncharacterized protein n=1 Tax=Dreissena polymorpha TaxID=45954 RepID=A0A9D4QPB3_DREPO|nr:uncharacterized protein LOC127879299 [Dreissena polymorpha]KAH3837557.1 hypothetical protein DPMN_110950 [Dreissena polymorpha]